MPAHYAPCCNCKFSEEAFYTDMFYCQKIERQIPNEETLHGCIFYERREMVEDD